MEIKFLVEEDFVNYKKASMFIGFPKCSFKCNKDNGRQVCQNYSLFCAPSKKVSVSYIIDRYCSNPITSALVIGGLEPFDSWDELIKLVTEFRKITDDDIVIYSGYYGREITDKILELEKFPNIIVKFGRYFPGDEPHYDEVLGVKLASNNQYARRLDENKTKS